MGVGLCRSGFNMGAGIVLGRRRWVGVGVEVGERVRMRGGGCASGSRCVCARMYSSVCLWLGLSMWAGGCGFVHKTAKQ